MIQLPVLTELKVRNYGLFPGGPNGSGITWSFQSGLSLIAGINGIGKTTLLTMILRSFTGPYDLTGDGEPQSLSVVLPEKPVSLRSQYTKFFEQRVADGAKNAQVALSAKIGDTHITISRRLKDISLEDLAFDGQSIELPTTGEERESIFQSRMTELIGLSSFVDVLLVLHHVILFHENRPGALWDPNAQRQLLRALCLNSHDALRVVKLERDLQSSDSQARNVHARITATERQLHKALRREAGSKGVFAQIEAEQQLLDVELKEAERLQEALEQFDETRKATRLAYERAKIEREAAIGAIERLKYTALLKHFPDMDDTTRLVMSRIMTDGRCLVCNAFAEEKSIELEQQVARGLCPVCGAEPQTQANVVAPYEFNQTKLEQERKSAERAKLEEDTKFRQLRDSTTKYDQTLAQLVHTRQSIKERKRKDQRLRAKLPDTTTSSEYENVVRTLQNDYREWLERRATALQELRSFLADREELIKAGSRQLTETFVRLTQDLLSEKVRLVQMSAEPRYMQAPGQAQDRVQVPAYAAEMEAADRPGFIRREDSSQVSESQRELVDLAFRLALVETFGDSCTFVMETPEASLDGLAMERVGRALIEFADKNDNRLVVTSNLSNAGIITALFGGPAPKGQSNARLQRVLNLLEVAVPNRALLENRERYDSLLQNAVSGVYQ